MSHYHRVSATDGDGDAHGDGNVGVSHADFRRRHTCTDVPCCLIFLVSLVAFGYLYVEALREGDVRRLFHGIDSQGAICGVDASAAARPYLYWCRRSSAADIAQNLRNFKLGQAVCVATCPGDGSQTMSGCGEAASYQTEAFLDRYCIPNENNLKDVATNITSQYMDNFDTSFAEALSSVPAGWPVILATFAIAVVLGYAHLTLLRCCAVVLLWVTIGVTVLGLAGAGGYLWTHAGQLLEHMPKDVQLPEGAAEHEGKATRAVAVLCVALAAAAACVACCMRQSVDAAAKCIQVACSAIFDMPSLLLTPVIKAAVKSVLFVALLYGFLELYSAGQVSNGAGDGVARVFTHSNPQLVKLFLYALMSYWILCFVNALYQFMVAYAVAQYYYEPHDEDGDKMVDGCCSAWEGFHVGFSFHAGSLAFGSFLLAFLHAVQKAIEYAEMKNKEGGNNKVVSCVLGICGCCIKCLQEVIGFINKNAYIDMAINSGSFCTSARNALAMIVELAGAMAILNGATFVFAVFGSALITLLSGAFAFVLCQMGTFAQEGSKYHIEEPLAVTVVAMCVAFLVSLAFMHVFDMASDTLLYCYGCDLHTGNHEHPHIMPELKELVDSHGSRGKEDPSEGQG